MDKSKIIEKLYDLCQLDFDAIQAYDQAIEKIDIETVADQLRRFRDDHQRHVTDLNAKIVAMGGKTFDRKPDIKGYLIEGFTSLRSVTGTAGALKAMRGNEMLTNSKYKSASEMDLPADIRVIVERNYFDEQRHLAYIQKCVDDQIWEQYPKGQAASTEAGPHVPLH